MKSSNEGRRNIKTERVKTAFAETAKKLIIEEGVESVSVRRVADLTGYTFATIYNHFKSADELLWHARNIMINDIVVYMEQFKDEVQDGVKGIQKLFSRYIEYYIKYPNVFRFFYFHRLKASDKPEIDDTDNPGPMQEQTLKAFEFLTDSGKYSAEDTLLILKTIIYSVHGLLTLSISDNDELNIHDAGDQLNDVIRFILRDLPEPQGENNEKKY